MASMSDNPLIGEYTKGISKGPEYFRNLERRVLRERACMQHVALDMQMGLFRDADLAVKKSISATGTGRFSAPKVVSGATKSLISGTLVARKTLVKSPVVLRNFGDLKVVLAAMKGA